MKRILKCWSFVIALSMVLSLFTVFGGMVSLGVGAIEIHTEADLRKIGTDAAYPLNGSYILMADIDMSKSAAWEGIGGADGFSGTFDGNGHTIIGMHAGTETAPYALKIHAWGLFPVLLEGATVKNVAFKDVFLNSTWTGTNTAIGTVAGYTNKENVTIENVAVLSGSLKGSCVRQTRVGGILGVTRAKNGTLIKNCFNGADVAADYTSTAGNCYISVAGIAARYEGTTAEKGLVNCFNAGKITALKTSGSTNYSSIGSIVALSNTTSSAQKDGANVINCATVKDLLVFDEKVPERITRYASDANPQKVKEVAPIVAGSAASYADFVTAAGGSWEVKDGYYPMITLFRDAAVAPASGGSAEAFVKTALEGLFVCNYLKEEQVLALVKDTLGDTFTVDSCKLELTKATAAQKGSFKITVTFGDGTKKYTAVHEGTFALPTIEYVFSTELAGRADGTITVTDPAYDIKKSYALYWGTAEGPLEGYSYLAKSKLLPKNGGILTYTVPNLVILPEKATHLWLTVNDTLVCSYELPASRTLKLGNLVYSYGAFSDLHFGEKIVPETFTSAMNLFASASAVFAVSTGDFTDSGTAADWSAFTTTYNAGGWKLPVWSCLGNHDILKWNIADGITPATALKNAQTALKTFVNEAFIKDENNNTYKVVRSEEYPDYDYTVKYGDDLFIYMSIGALKNDSDKNYDQHLAKEQLTWLEGVLNDYYNKEAVYGHVYLIFHYYTMESGFGMYQNGATSGTEWSRDNGYMTPGYNSSEELFKILSKHSNVIHFSGHSHRVFEADNNLSVTQKYYRVDNQGNYRMVDKPLGYTAVHLPALSVSKEGYLVSVYSDGVLLTGYNFGENKIVPNATFFVANDNEKTNLRFNESLGEYQFVRGLGTWNTLISEDALKTSDGKTVELQAGETHLQWKYSDGTDWTDLVALSDLVNAEGVPAELQIANCHFQLRYGTSEWKDLAELSNSTNTDQPQDTVTDSNASTDDTTAPAGSNTVVIVAIIALAVVAVAAPVVILLLKKRRA